MIGCKIDALIADGTRDDDVVMVVSVALPCVPVEGAVISSPSGVRGLVTWVMLTTNDASAFVRVRFDTIEDWRRYLADVNGWHPVIPFGDFWLWHPKMDGGAEKSGVRLCRKLPGDDRWAEPCSSWPLLSSDLLNGFEHRGWLTKSVKIPTPYG